MFDLWLQMGQSGYTKIYQRSRVRIILQSEHTVTLVIKNLLSFQYLENILLWACFNETQVLRACTVFERQRVPQLRSSSTDPFLISLKLKKLELGFCKYFVVLPPAQCLNVRAQGYFEVHGHAHLSNFKISNIDLKFTLNLVAVAPPRSYTF